MTAPCGVLAQLETLIILIVLALVPLFLSHTTVNFLVLISLLLPLNLFIARFEGEIHSSSVAIIYSL